ncbi:hypothetical protein [Mycoplasma sp. 1654_15]|uniref:hypothetical protein n=1 Tax=Mycoplasma sp. 1654_15 TaxID=2725994 RepID=UPI00159AE249|nr:hypothetical protein [Mycoplasma sp. 1654_15]QKG28220.1 hypothetical protein HF996_03845 [Mycoplasma sp. 1654_15]
MSKISFEHFLIPIAEYQIDFTYRQHVELEKLEFFILSLIYGGQIKDKSINLDKTLKEEFKEKYNIKEKLFVYFQILLVNLIQRQIVNLRDKALNEKILQNSEFDYTELNDILVGDLSLNEDLKKLFDKNVFKSFEAENRRDKTYAYIHVIPELDGAVEYRERRNVQAIEYNKELLEELRGYVKNFVNIEEHKEKRRKRAIAISEIIEKYKKDNKTVLSSTETELDNENINFIMQNISFAYNSSDVYTWEPTNESSEIIVNYISQPEIDSSNYFQKQIDEFFKSIIKKLDACIKIETHILDKFKKQLLIPSQIEKWKDKMNVLSQLGWNNVYWNEKKELNFIFESNKKYLTIINNQEENRNINFEISPHFVNVNFEEQDEGNKLILKKIVLDFLQNKIHNIEEIDLKQYAQIPDFIKEFFYSQATKNPTLFEKWFNWVVGSSLFKIEDIFEDWNVFDLWSRNENIAKDFLKLLDKKGINIKQRLIEDAKTNALSYKNNKIFEFCFENFIFEKITFNNLPFLEYWSLTKSVEDLKNKYKELKNSLDEIVYTFKNKDISKFQEDQMFAVKRNCEMEINKFNQFIKEVETFCTKNKAFVDIPEIEKFSDEVLQISTFYQQDLKKECMVLANNCNTEIEKSISDGKIENLIIEVDALFKKGAITSEEGNILKELRNWRNGIFHKTEENKEFTIEEYKKYLLLSRKLKGITNKITTFRIEEEKRRKLEEQQKLEEENLKNNLS